MTRYAIVTMEGSDIPKRMTYALGRVKVASHECSMIELAGVEGRAVATARVLASGATSVLLVGLEVLRYWRPEMKLKEVQGVPMVLGYEYGTRVVGLPTMHWGVAYRTKELREAFEEDLAQWSYRGKADRFSRWPRECVKCRRTVDHYDVMGLAWCGVCFRGPEPPEDVVQLRVHT